MIPPLRPFVLGIAATCALFSGATAQDSADAPMAKLRVLALPPKTEHPSLQLLQGKEAAVELEISSSRLTGPYKVRNDGRWRFAETAPGDETGKPKPLASCKAGRSSDQLAVLVRKPGNDAGYGAFAVNMAPAAFGQRQFLIVNLSPGELAGELGGKKVALPPGKPVVVTPKADKGKDLCQAAFYARKGEKWHPFHSTSWPLRDKLRGLIFLYQDTGNGKIQLHAISDFL